MAQDPQSPRKKRGQRGPDKPDSPRAQVSAALVASKVAGRELLRQMVEARLGPCLTAMLDQACGASVFLVKDESGKWVRVTDPKIIDTYLAFPPEQYWKISTADPDINAAKYLLDQHLGKAVETHEHTGADGGPIVLTWED